MQSTAHHSSAPVFAVVTPFAQDRALDVAAFRDYLAWLQGAGVQRIVVGGTTGEFCSLTLAERRTLLEAARDVFDGQVFAHVSTCSLADTRMLISHAYGIADAVLLLPPYYFADVTAQGVQDYLVGSVGDCQLPLYLYNFPRHTQFNILPDLLSSLTAELPTLKGIKDSGGKWDQSLAYKQAAPQLDVIVGLDSAALRVLEQGLDGSVTGGANPVPRRMLEVHARFIANDPEGAQVAQQKLDAWTSARKAIGIAEIALVKAALSHLIPGFPAYARPPLIGANLDDLTGFLQSAINS